ncbi:MAG: thiamine pyrophosphate-dependent enzyme, partial [Pseudomonadota bacterium]
MIRTTLMAKDGDVPPQPAPSGGISSRAGSPADLSFASGANAAYVENLYARYASDPNSVSADWRAYFAGLGDSAESARRNAEGPSWSRADWPPHERSEAIALLDGDWPVVEKSVSAKIEARAPSLDGASVRRETRDSLSALMLIRAYRIRGHMIADLDPLHQSKKKLHSELDPATYGFSPADMDRPIFIDHVLGLETATMREILETLQRTYCGTFAVEFMHISDPEQKSWIQQRIEGKDKEITFTPEGKKAILNKLIAAEGFENFMQTKYTGTKRFGLDGGEATVPALEQIIKRGGALGVKEIVIGMPHRGRLNVLAAVMGKPYHHIFHEFSGGSVTPQDVEGSGDVKYHLGASSDREFDANRVHLSLTANPSHLEAVDPVVLGKCRSKQDRIEPGEIETPRTHVLPLLLHGDAAFAGQGIVAECLGFSGLRGYRTGGAIHFIVNNQIGFTTAPKFSRSSPYPSDLATGA